MGCVFCDIVDKHIDSFPIYQTKESLAFLDAFPITPGHILVIPKNHYEQLTDIPVWIYQDLFDTAIRIIQKLRQNPEYVDFNLWSSLGKNAGQTVFHAHIHILPRVDNDRLFQFPSTCSFQDKNALAHTQGKIRDLLGDSF